METEKQADVRDPMDFYDFGPEPPDDPEYDEATLPDYIKAAIAQRKAQTKQPTE